MATTTARQVVYDIASGYKTATGDTTEINYENVTEKVLAAIGSGGGVEITDITLNADGTYTVTDKDNNTHTLAVTETDGQITAITYDGNNVPLSFDNNGYLIGVGDADIDIDRYPNPEIENIGYYVKFKIDGNDYYIASCKQGESISKPPIDVELGVWQDAQGNNISFPYTPNADIELYNTYRQVEYIEVTSMGAYIDTGTPHTSNAYWEIECNYTSNPSNNYALFGASYQYGEYTINLYNSAPYICAGTGSGGNKATIPEPLVRHKYTANNSGLYADDVLLSSNVIWNNNPNINYYIFAMNYNGTTYSTANARVYSCKIWNGDTLVRNFVPCYRVSDNEIGMYDLVTETFFTNAGTGSFSKGADVT